ncbi:MAG: benenodin family lasso peptide [Lysobacteraceae bacterium]
MNTHDDTHTRETDDVIELGVASVETLGQAGITENFGVLPPEGISAE